MSDMTVEGQTARSFACGKLLRGVGVEGLRRDARRFASEVGAVAA